MFNKLVGALLTFLLFTAYVEGYCYPATNCYNYCWTGNLWIEAEFLWWKPCISNARAGSTTTLPIGTGENKLNFICYDWKPGVRGSIGYDDLFCGWNLAASYTYIQPEGQVSRQAPVDSVILSDFLGSKLGAEGASFNYDTLTSLFQKHRITYQTWEIILSTTCPTCCATLIPYFGVEGLLLHQRLDVAATSGANSVFFDVKLDYHGAGLKAGLDVDFPLFSCFSFFINPSFALVYGLKHWDIDADGVTNDEAPLPVTFEGRGCTCVLVPGFDIQIGLTYGLKLCETIIGLRTGWEFHQWTNVPQINLLNSTDDTLTLGLQGFFLSGFVAF